MTPSRSDVAAMAAEIDALPGCEVYDREDALARFVLAKIEAARAEERERALIADGEIIDAAREWVANRLCDPYGRFQQDLIDVVRLYEARRVRVAAERSAGEGERG